LLVAPTVVVGGFLLLLLRFTWLQVIRHADFLRAGEQNRIALVPVTATAPDQEDRNGAIIAKNYSAYTLEIAYGPGQERRNDDRRAVQSDPGRAARRRPLLQADQDYKRLDSVPIRTRLTDEEVARFAAQRYRFPRGVARAPVPPVPAGPETAAHVLGYIAGSAPATSSASTSSQTRNDYNGTSTSARSASNPATRSICTHHRLRTGRDHGRRTPVRTAIAPPRNPATTWSCRSTSSCSSWSRRHSAIGADALIAIEPDTGTCCLRLQSDVRFRTGSSTDRFRSAGRA